MNIPEIHRFSSRVALIAVCCLVVAASSLSAGEIAWAPLDIDQARARAASEGKLIHIFVEGDNCPPCEAYQRTHLSDPAYIDYMSTLFVNIRAHEGEANSGAFLQSLNLTHPIVPRYYVLDANGNGISMAYGMVAAPPMQGAEVLAMAAGADLPVNAQAAAALAGRLRAHAASQRASGTISVDHPLRPLGLAILEAQAWALAGRLDEAENAFGPQWVSHLSDQEVRSWYVNFWLGWKRNLPAALAAAQLYNETTPGDPNGIWLVASSLAANNRHKEAVAMAEPLLAENPNLAEAVNGWRNFLPQ